MHGTVGVQAFIEDKQYAEFKRLSLQAITAVILLVLFSIY